MSWTLYNDFRNLGDLQPHSIYPDHETAMYYFNSYKADGYMVKLEKSDRSIDEPIIFVNPIVFGLSELPKSWAESLSLIKSKHGTKK